MISFADILYETNKMLQMQDEFLVSIVAKAEKPKSAPSIAAPATEIKHGEQKAPVAKPNRVLPNKSSYYKT